MFISNILQRVRRTSPKQLVVATAFVVALAGAISLGHATRQKSSAAGQDCTANSIVYCGAVDVNDFANKYKANATGDLPAIYAKYGMQSSELTKFVTSAKAGVAKNDGTIVVDGRIVATNVWSLGRNANSHYPQKAVNINGKTYYESSNKDVMLSSSIPVMVLFNDKGVMQFAVMTACANPNYGTPEVPSYACDNLKMDAVSGKDNTYNFSTAASAAKGATIDHVVYDFGDGSATVTKTNPAEQVTHTYTKEGNFSAKVTVYVKVPGGATQVIAAAGSCVKKVTVKLPYYACTALVATVLNDKKTQFRFTVKTNQGNGATLKDADFTLDGKNTTTGVATKDANGNIYKEYSFDDAVEHKIAAKVNFNVAGGVQSKACETKVTPEKTPMCTVPGKEKYPPNAPECQEECKPGVPVGSPECTPTPETPVAPASLPNTGMGNVVGLFAGTSAAGAAVHRVVTSRRRRS